MNKRDELLYDECLKMCRRFFHKSEFGGQVAQHQFRGFVRALGLCGVITPTASFRLSALDFAIYATPRGAFRVVKSLLREGIEDVEKGNFSEVDSMIANVVGYPLQGQSDLEKAA